MKKFSILLLICGASLTGCDYLDIVPDERPLPENTYQNPAVARNYLYSCYSQIPDLRISDALDKFTAGEIAFPNERSDFQQFPNGFYSPSKPSISKSQLYDKIWQGIHQCYQFLEVVDMTPDILATDLQYYKAEATLLIAYYHWLSVRSYGPTVIVRDKLNPLTSYLNMPERSSVDEVIKFIDEKITEAESIGLADVHDQDSYGRLTSYAAKALRSRVYLYAASPLFNGNSEFYSNFKSPLDDRFLISQDFDIKKWEKVEKVTREAINNLESAGYRLYTAEDAGTPTAQKPCPVDKAQRAVRYTFMDNVGGTNPEVIMVDTRKEGIYALQNQSTPRQTGKNGYKKSWNMVCPTLQTVEMFYTENGLPIDEDPTFDYNGRFDIVNQPVNYDHNNYSTKSNGTTIKLHLNREPRFYSWIGFHNGFYEIAKFNGKPTSTNNAKKTIVVRFKEGDEQGVFNNQYNTCYLNKKFVHPSFQSGPVHYPYPVIRMAEMYLNLAESLIEQDLATGNKEHLNEAKELIDRVRIRAGIPTIDEAWSKSKHPEKAQTAEGLREIIRRERQIEFYLENQRFWDLRRWKIAECLGEPVKSLNGQGKTDEEFYKPIEMGFIRNFKQAQYLMPIPLSETNKIPHYIQNPGY